MGMGQYGGGKLGGVALQAGGMVPLPFTAMPSGPIAALLLILTFSLVSSGAGFNLTVDTGSSAASEGTDDTDILINSLLPNLQLYSDPATSQANFGTQAWRTWLGFANVHDFEGTFANGVAIPATGNSAKALSIAMVIPYSMHNSIFDGEAFHQGSTRLKTGRLEFTAGASLTPSPVLVNGTAVVSNFAVNVFPIAGAGTENDVGALWSVTRPANTQTIYDLDPADYVFVALQSLLASIGSGKPILIGPFENWSPDAFIAKYQADQLTAGGYDITARCTPLLTMDRHRRFGDMVATSGQVIHADLSNTSLTSGSWIFGKLISPSPALLQDLAQKVGAGGAVSIAPIRPPSGLAVPQLLGHIAPQRLVPGAVSAAGITTGSPAKVGQTQGAKIQGANYLAQVAKNFGRK